GAHRLLDAGGGARERLRVLRDRAGGLWTHPDCAARYPVLRGRQERGGPVALLRGVLPAAGRCEISCRGQRLVGWHGSLARPATRCVCLEVFALVPESELRVELVRAALAKVRRRTLVSRRGRR